jgi:hypothetical protein
MKTTIDIADSLLEEARLQAHRQGTTVRALVEQGLRQVLAEQARRPGFTLRKASFRGKGLRPEMSGVSWERLRELAYEGRGAP